jgi:hypothetical protein
MIEIVRTITVAVCLLLTNTAHAEEMTVEQMKAMNVCTRFLDAHPIVDGVPSHGNPVGDAQEQFMFKYAVEQVRKQHKNPATTIGIAPMRLFVYDWCERHQDQSMVRAMYGYVAGALGELTLDEVMK